MAGGGDADDLAALLEQVSVTSASDLAYQLQLAEAIQASPESSGAAYALALHAADLARAELDRRDALALHARTAASVRVAAHDARFARELAAVTEDRWAHDGDCFERPLGSPDSSSAPLFRVCFKGMASRDVCGPQGEVMIRVQKQGL